MNEHATRALDLYRSARQVATAIVDEMATLHYIFTFVVEDAKHGDEKIGTNAVLVDAFVPLTRRSTNRIAFQHTKKQETGLKDCDLANVKCSVEISTTDVLYSFLSSKTEVGEAANKNSPATHVFTVPDNVAMLTVDSPLLPTWEIKVITAPRDRHHFVELEFTHDPTAHPLLMWLIMRTTVSNHLGSAMWALEETKLKCVAPPPPPTVNVVPLANGGGWPEPEPPINNGATTMNADPDADPDDKLIARNAKNKQHFY